MRQTFSEFRKKARGKLSKLGDKLGGEGTNVNGNENRRPASPLSLRFEPGIVAEDRLGDGIRIGVGKSDPRPDNPLPISRSAVEIGQNHGESDDKANAGEIGQKYIRPHSHAQTESGPSREGEDVGGESAGQAHPHTEPDVGDMTTPPILRDGETDSMWTTPFR